MRPGPRPPGRGNRRSRDDEIFQERVHRRPDRGARGPLLWLESPQRTKASTSLSRISSVRQNIPFLRRSRLRRMRSAGDKGGSFAAWAVGVGAVGAALVIAGYPCGQDRGNSTTAGRSMLAFWATREGSSSTLIFRCFSTMSQIGIGGAI